MRALVMDFNGDREVENIGNQWMLGPALMACPVESFSSMEKDKVPLSNFGVIPAGTV